NASKESGEPNHAGEIGGKSVWFLWRAPAVGGIATFDTIGSTFDTLLAVYTGTDFSNLVERTSDDDRGRYFRSRVQFNAPAGQTSAFTRSERLAPAPRAAPWKAGRQSWKSGHHPASIRTISRKRSSSAALPAEVRL